MAFPSHLVKKWGAELGWACEVCGRKWKDGWLLEGHHRVPSSQGGQNTRENFQLLCIEHHYLAHKKLRKEGKDHPASVFVVYARWKRTKGRWK